MELQRCRRAASLWYHPALAVTMCLVAVAPVLHFAGLMNGLWVSLAGAGAVLVIVMTHRRYVGITAASSTSAVAVIVGAAVGVVLIGLVSAALLPAWLESMIVAGALPVVAFVVTLCGCIALDRIRTKALSGH